MWYKAALFCGVCVCMPSNDYSCDARCAFHVDVNSVLHMCRPGSSIAYGSAMVMFYTAAASHSNVAYCELGTVDV